MAKVLILSSVTPTEMESPRNNWVLKQGDFVDHPKESTMEYDTILTLKNTKEKKLPSLTPLGTIKSTNLHWYSIY